MKTLVATMAIFAMAYCATPAIAHVVEVTTSVSMASGDDDGQVKDALTSAIQTVLRTAIGFTPTLVVLTNARTHGDRLYVRLVIADAEGEETLKALTEGEKEPAEGESPTLDRQDRTVLQR